MKFKIPLIIYAILGMLSSLHAQVNPAGQSPNSRIVSSAVPFMRIAPDARAGGIGDAGVATSPDVNSSYWNIGKLALIKSDIGLSLSHTSWLGKVIPDRSLSYFSGYYKINGKQTIGLSMNYFNQTIQNFNAKGYSITGSYSRALSKNMSIGASLKYIHSNIPGNVFSSTGDGQAGVSIAADIGWYWNKDFSEKSNLAFGATITDIGNKITYSNDEQKRFIPTTLRFGSAYKLKFDPLHSLTFALDFSKLMVPTPPVYVVDNDGRVVYDQNGNPQIARGQDPDRALLIGVFGSFTDAPDGAVEEFREVVVNYGMEYWYKDVISVRGGYFWESYDKGNRKFFTMGLGVKYNAFGLDLAYLVPQKREEPIAETLRFTLLFDFYNQQRQDSIKN